MKIADAIAVAERNLAESGASTPRLDAEVLLAHALKIERPDLYLARDGALRDDASAEFDGLIARRSRGEPVAYITGVKEFWSMPIKVAPGVLVPRPETEFVVECALGTVADRGAAVDILDLGTGSGNIVAALASELPNARFVMTDISDDAIAIAVENTSFAGKRIFAKTGDLFGAVGDDLTFDIITANPPYIALCDKESLSRDIVQYEPHEALFAGPSGLDLIGRIIKDAGRHLKDGGWLVMEMGIGQGESVKGMAIEAGFAGEIGITKDLSGIDRVICIEGIWRS